VFFAPVRRDSLAAATRYSQAAPRDKRRLDERIAPKVHLNNEGRAIEALASSSLHCRAHNRKSPIPIAPCRSVHVATCASPRLDEQARLDVGRALAGLLRRTAQ
jgi:hypothetical protein